jgi:type III secretion system YscQ/HrcQ family protein
VSADPLTPPSVAFHPGPLGILPFVSGEQVRLERVFDGAVARDRLRRATAWLVEPLGAAVAIGPVEIQLRAAGLGRPGVTAQLSVPGRHTVLGLGFETPLVHALIDRLLGFERQPGEERLQVTPVEWGVLTYILARTLAEFAAEGTPGLLLDRVGPEPIPAGAIADAITVRWPVQVGAIAGSVRLWLPGPLAAKLARSTPPAPPPDALRTRFGMLAGCWRALAGSVSMPRGLGRLRVGGVHPIDGAALRGTPTSPEGPVELSARDRDGRSWFEAEAVPLSGGGRIRLRSPLRREILPREAVTVSTPTEPPGGTPAATDVPVTLAVELGRISLPLLRVADLKPGDVLELGRHAREPVELTSNGRLVARGELVQIDTELGVRITHVFL